MNNKFSTLEFLSQLGVFLLQGQQVSEMNWKPLCIVDIVVGKEVRYQLRKRPAVEAELDFPECSDQQEDC